MKNDTTASAPRETNRSLGGSGPPPPSATPPPLPTYQGAQSVPPSVIPEFPFPPPRASAMETVERRLLVGSNKFPSLKTVGDALDAAFERCRYSKRKYYAVPGGFAMASSLEQIEDDGSPKSANRWSRVVKPMASFSLRNYLRALFNARPGHYRVIVFVVTNSLIFESKEIGDKEADAWVEGGSLVLPDEIGDRDFTPQHRCTAMIYEFRSLGNGDAEFVKPSEITAQTHLKKTGFFAAPTDDD